MNFYHNYHDYNLYVHGALYNEFYILFNRYFLRLEFFAIWAPKHSILIFAFLIFAIPFNRKNQLFSYMSLIFICSNKMLLKRLNISSLLLFTAYININFIIMTCKQTQCEGEAKQSIIKSVIIVYACF